MRKLAEQLKKIDLELPKWTRDILFAHLLEVCKDIKQNGDFKSR